MTSSPAPAAVSNRDFDFFYTGLAAHQLLVQRCDQCATLRCPPGPACPACHSFAWTVRPLAGTGTLFSYTVHHHPALAGFETPLPIALVEMAEGIRMIGPMDGTAPERLHIGMAVTSSFVDRGGIPGFRFSPAEAP